MMVSIQSILKTMIFLIFLFSLALQTTLYSEKIPPILGGFESREEDEKKTKNIKLIPSKEIKKKIPTSWGGGALTQEEKTYQGFPVTTFTLSNGAYIKHKTITLKANTIEVVGNEALFANLKNGVFVEDTENRITLTAGKAEYNKFEELIVMSNRPILNYFNSDNKPTKVTAPSIKRFMSESKVVLEGRVVLQDPDFTIIGDNAIYYEKENLLVLEGYPIFFGEKKVLTGEKAKYDNNQKKTIVEGNTIAVIESLEEIKVEKDNSSIPITENTVDLNSQEDLIDRDKNELVINKNIENQELNTSEVVKLNEINENAKKKIVTIFSADRLESTTSNNKEENTVSLLGDAKVHREDYVFKSNKLIAKGQGYKTIFSDEPSIFMDKVQNNRLTGGLFEHFEETQYTHVTKDPKIEFFNKEGQINSTLTCVEVERFVEKKEVVFRGNLQLDSENGLIKGQYATYYEDEKKLVVEGKPTLEKDGGKVDCGKITIFTEENRILITEGIGAEKLK
jgi:lipopolysaccharide export system protein LptA